MLRCVVNLVRAVQVSMKVDVLIIGAGAAGLMCAIAAGQRGRRVLVVDHANKVGKKILMSGGGRCNFTNMGTTPANFLSANPHFAKSALARYTPWDFIALVEKHRIAYHEKELGQLFCDESSKQIVRMLLDECAAAGVTVEASCAVQRVRKIVGGVRRGHIARARCMRESLVVATGGLSIPSMGATGFGYELAQQFGHGVLPTRAGLVPLTLSGKHQEHYQDLAGVALPVAEARVGKQSFRAGLLFTHRGISGPSILQISSYWQPGDDLRVDLLARQRRRRLADRTARRTSAGRTEDGAGRGAAQTAGAAPVRAMVRKPADAPVPRSRTGADRRAAARAGRSWPVAPKATARPKSPSAASIPMGLSSSTMESRRVPGLYFIGEVVDVTGWLGGYNFQWAWASGQAAGQVA